LERHVLQLDNTNRTVNAPTNTGIANLRLKLCNLIVPSGTRAGAVPIAITKNGKTRTSSVIIETK